MIVSIEAALIHYNEKEYTRYINEHIKNVQKAWENIKSNFMAMEYIKNTVTNYSPFLIDTIDELVKNHDASKYSEFEFDAYRRNFYPISPEEKENNKEDFEKAWKHHYMNNLHHWNYWYNKNDMDAMPFPYIIEMICDWEAMSYKFGGTSKEWYENNKGDIHLGNKQKEIVESLLNIICK